MQRHGSSFVSWNALPSTSFVRQVPTPNDVHAETTTHDLRHHFADVYDVPQAADYPHPQDAYDAPGFGVDLPPMPSPWSFGATPHSGIGSAGLAPAPLDPDRLAFALAPYAQAQDAPCPSACGPADETTPRLGAVNVRAAPFVFGHKHRTLPLAPPPSLMPSVASSGSSASSWLGRPLHLGAATPASTASSTSSLAAPTLEATQAKRQRFELVSVLDAWGYDAELREAVATGVAGSEGSKWLVAHVSELHDWGFAAADVAQLLQCHKVPVLACLLAYARPLVTAGLDPADVVRLVHAGGTASLVTAAAYAPLLAGQGMAQPTLSCLFRATPSASLLAAIAVAAPTTRAMGLALESLVSVALGPNGEAGVTALDACGPSLLKRGACASQLVDTLCRIGGETKTREMFRAWYVPLGTTASTSHKRKAGALDAFGTAPHRVG